MNMKTQPFIQHTSGVNILVVEKTSVRAILLDTKAEWTVGRQDPNRAIDPDIALTSALVSRRHGWFRNVGGRWYFTDNKENTNGTFHNGRKLGRSEKEQNTSVPLQNGDILRIDYNDLSHPDPNGVLILFTTLPIQGNYTPFSLSNKKTVTIGRDPQCDICENQAYFSSKHAEIKYKNGQYYLSDCNSLAGTFLNGVSVSAPTPLHEKDIIRICDRTYFFLGDNLLYPTQQHGTRNGFVLKADIDYKRVKNNAGSGTKELIRDIHLQVREGTTVALLGTAGAGKSTIMNCLNGMDLQGVQGSVIYRGIDLMRNFDQMKHMIGIVPQEKIFHPDFSPEMEFRNAAIKRLPADTTDREIKERVEKTLKLLGIYDVRNSKNSKLSGGEKTRVNIGIELVADRDLLCLDEPDQGLDPKNKHAVFQILQDLAHKNGKTVISIIHDVSEVDLFDQVIMLVKSDGVGRLAFSGTPGQMRKKFCVDDIKAIYRLLEENPHRYIH